MDEPLKRDEALKHQADCIGWDFYSCEEAVKRLNEYLDHQLTDADRIVVLKHLEICRPCLRRFTFEQTLVISLRQKVSHLCVPPTLREKLHGLLRDKNE
ncbi:MAG: zf-HC2 domain-containing protein [Armatimonadota bacterium]|nr:zf-HC2 domain-containing protein [Armatimonadota bacterium]